MVCLSYKGYVIKEYFMNHFLHNLDITIDLVNDKMEVYGTSTGETNLNTKTAVRLKKVKKYIGN